MISDTKFNISFIQFGSVKNTYHLYFTSISYFGRDYPLNESEIIAGFTIASCTKVSWFLQEDAVLLRT